MPEVVTVLGLDIGYAKLGYGIVELKGNKIYPVEYGIITTRSDQEFPDRLIEINQDLNLIVQRQQPTTFAYEVVPPSNKSGVQLAAQALGVIRLTLGQCGYRENNGYSPSELKKTITGKGTADKPHVQICVESMLGQELQINRKTEDDAADAMAIAICHLIKEYNYNPLVNAA
jgi:crossover junction endodeoxyribonuclease RuvC